MDFKTDMTDRLTRRLCSGAEADGQRAARVRHLGEFVWRGDYQVAARDIVEAMLATGPRFTSAPASGHRSGRGVSHRHRSPRHF